MSQNKTKINCILLIDDDDIFNLMNSTIIKKANVSCCIDIATSADEGLRALIEPRETLCQNVDLILLDLNMPGKTGWDFLEEFDKLDDSIKSYTKIIILTSSNNPEDYKRAERNPHVMNITAKPLTISNIQQLIEDYFV